MAMPYTVTVKDNNGEIAVTVRPQPTATKDVYLPAIMARMQGILMAPRNNSVLGRGALKRELIDALTDFHAQSMIQPMKEKDEGIL